MIGVSEAQKLFVVMEEKDTVSWNSMIGGLGKAGELSDARRLFDEMPERDTVSWNAILDGYVEAGQMNEAFELFEKMPQRNVVSWSTLVSGYSKPGDMSMASMMFDRMPFRNLVHWTIIISGYAEKGLAKVAIMLYDQMEEAGLKLGNDAIISILAACAENRDLLGLVPLRRTTRSMNLLFLINYTLNPDEVYGMIDKLHLDFKQMNVSSWCISNGIGGQTAKDSFYLVSIS